MDRLKISLQYILIVLAGVLMSGCADITAAIGPGFWAWLIIGIIAVGVVVMLWKGYK
jgi:hypothetical protein